MSKNQNTGTATQPQRNRKLCQFNKDQYCMILLHIGEDLCHTVIRNRTTVHFILDCQTIFLRFLFYSLLFQAETYMVCFNFFMYSETKFQLDSTKNEKCPERSPL